MVLVSFAVDRWNYWVRGLIVEDCSAGFVCCGMIVIIRESFCLRKELLGLQNLISRKEFVFNARFTEPVSLTDIEFFKHCLVIV